MVGDALKVNTTLIILDIGDNKIGPEGAKMIAEALKVNTTLADLILFRNEIGSEGAKNLNRCLDINTSLVKLNLDNNDIPSSLENHLKLLVSQNAQAKEMKEQENNSFDDKIVFAGVNGRANRAETLIRERLGEELINTNTNVKETSQPPQEESQFITNAKRQLNMRNITLVSKLGNGVWKGHAHNSNVAVKFSQEKNQEAVHKTMRELSFLGTFKHDRIVSYLMFVGEVPAIVMAMAEGGSIADVLKSRDKPIGWGLRMKWAMQLAEGLVAMHAAGIIHRDLRASNILLTANHDVMISDFGISYRQNEIFKSSQRGEMFGVEERLTYDATFDCRLYGILLAQLLYAKNYSNINLLDDKTKKISREIPCDRKEYMDLIDLSFHENTNACKLLSFAQSVTAHFFGGKYQSDYVTEQQEINRKIQDLDNQDDKADLQALDYLMKVNEKPVEMIESVLGIMTYPLNEECQLAVARFFATIPPKDLLPYLTRTTKQNAKGEDEMGEIYKLAYDLVKRRGNKNTIDLFKKSVSESVQQNDGFMSKECVEVLLSCLFEAEDEAYWTKIITAFREGKVREEDRPQVINTLRKKLEVSDTEKVNEFHIGMWKGNTILSMIHLGVKEDWMAGAVVSALQQSLSRKHEKDDEYRDDIASLQCLSLLRARNDEVKKQVIAAVEWCQDQDDDTGNVDKVLLEALKLMGTMINMDDDMESFLMKLFQHKNEEIRIAAARIMAGQTK
eukprot:TRINITY_DN2347_c1_g2_i2.p1 TRINITY_DN2347_c1_g2~~TRINITY_DN2347_c1_g2_i2.p1  ORF type:complete len:733 (-),score=159.84 TRINITY_DN2347_c1_g2_i2:80-2278(-)